MTKKGILQAIENSHEVDTLKMIGWAVLVEVSDKHATITPDEILDISKAISTRFDELRD